MRYEVQGDPRSCRSTGGPARVVACVPVTTGEGPDGVGVCVDIVGTGGLRIQFAFQPADLDDEAQCAQLVRLAERLQLMATAAGSRRAAGVVARRPCPAFWRAGILTPPDAPADGAPCTRELGHDGEHEFRPER